MILPPGSSSSRVPIVEPITDSCRKNAVVGVLAALVVLRPSALRALGSGPRHGGLGLRPLPAVLQADGDLHGGSRHLAWRRRPPRAGARAGHQPAVRGVLRRCQAGRIPAHRRCQRLSPGGICRV
jgi:hypothetical protein